MRSRLADHLDAARCHRFVGRETERAVFQSALLAETLPFYVLQIFGPGGVGKTTLLQEMSALCRQHAIVPISLDARNVDPSPPAFIQALQLAMRLGPETAPLEALDLPFSTYRRYRKAAITRVTEILWHKEISI